MTLLAGQEERTVIFRFLNSSTTLEALIISIDRPRVSMKVWYSDIEEERTGAVVSYRMFLVAGIVSILQCVNAD